MIMKTNSNNIIMASISVVLNGKNETTVFKSNQEILDDFEGMDEMLGELIAKHDFFTGLLIAKFRSNQYEFGTYPSPESNMNIRYCKSEDWMVVLALPQDIWGVFDEQVVEGISVSLDVA